LNSKEHGEGDHWTNNNDGSHVCNKKEFNTNLPLRHGVSNMEGFNNEDPLDLDPIFEIITIELTIDHTNFDDN
jgi:hypothetical protein